MGPRRPPLRGQLLICTATVLVSKCWSQMDTRGSPRSPARALESGKGLTRKLWDSRACREGRLVDNTEKPGEHAWGLC